MYPGPGPSHRFHAASRAPGLTRRACAPYSAWGCEGLSWPALFAYVRVSVLHAQALRGAFTRALPVGILVVADPCRLAPVSRFFGLYVFPEFYKNDYVHTTFALSIA